MIKCRLDAIIAADLVGYPPLFWANGKGGSYGGLTLGRSMFEIIPEPERPVTVIRASGLLRASDYEDTIPELKSSVAETPHRALLFDWTDLKGWEEEAESIRFFARLDLRALFERVAILADKAWEPEVNRLREVSALPVRRFPPSDRGAALDWLESDCE